MDLMEEEVVTHLKRNLKEHDRIFVYTTPIKETHWVSFLLETASVSKPLHGRTRVRIRARTKRTHARAHAHAKYKKY